MKKFLVLVFSINTIIANCQSFKNLNPSTVASPNAASLGIFGDIPVDYCTGIPDLSIPLYELKEDNITIPITLRYHGAGVKPNIYPSWVGLNWTLFAGGSITRSVNYTPDEQNRSNQNSIVPGYFYNTYLLNSASWFQFPTNSVEQLKDAAPDEFSFNFNGISGKFYLDHLGTWQVKSDHEIKVICTASDIKSLNYGYLFKDAAQVTKYDYEAFTEAPRFDGYAKMFSQFILITEDGTQYVFGGSRSSIEFTRSRKYTDNPDIYPVATTWNLTKIISAEGNEVFNLEYERLPSDLVLFLFNSTCFGQVNANGTTSPASGNSLDYYSRLIEPSYLKSISSKNQKIIFSSVKSPALGLNIVGTGILWKNSYAEQYKDIHSKLATDPNDYFYYEDDDETDFSTGRKLTKIEIHYNTPLDQSLFKSYDFSYYETSTERLKLKSVEEVAVGESNHAIYNLEYYSTGTSLPDFKTKKIDHWGFFNNTTSVLPTSIGDQNQLDSYYNSRNPASDPNVYLIDMLKKITYPTGGTTTLEYEPNYYSEFIHRVPLMDNGNIGGLNKLECVPRSTQLLSGGLRVKKITSSPNVSGQDIIKEYYYVKDYQYNDTPSTLLTKLSSGQLQTEILENPDQGCINAEAACLAAQEACEVNCLQLHHPGTPEYDECMENCQCNYNCFYEGISPYYKSGHLLVGTTTIGWFKIFAVSPILPLSDNNGNHIVYGEVVERINNGGYTKYKYDIQNNAINQYFDELPVNSVGNTFYADLSSKLLTRNTLKTMELYNNSGSLVKDIKYYYNSDQPQGGRKIRTRTITFDSYVFGEGSGRHGICSLSHGTAGLIYIFNSYLKSKTETDYYSNVPVSSTSTFKYGGLNDKLLEETSLTQSDGSVLYTRYKYSTDYQDNVNNSLADPNTKAIHIMQIKHIIEPIEIIKTKKVADVEKIAEGKLTLFNTFSPSVIKPLKVLLLELTQPLLSTEFTPSNINSSYVFGWDSHYGEKIKYNNYDIYGNLLEYQENDNIPISFLYSYKYSFPIVKFTNLTFSDIESTLSGTSTPVSHFTDNYYTQDQYLQKFATIRDLFPNTMIETYVYDVIKGISVMSGFNSINSYYKYDGFGRLKWIKDDDAKILKTYEYHYK